MRFEAALPPRKSYRRGAAYAYDCVTRVLTVAATKTPCVYRLTEVEVPEGDGVAYRLDKATVGTDPEGDGYVVFVANRRGHDSCECRGFLAHGVCKHTDAVRGLVKAKAFLTLDVVETPVVTENEIDDMVTAWEARHAAEAAAIDRYWADFAAPQGPVPF